MKSRLLLSMLYISCSINATGLDIYGNPYVVWPDNRNIGRTDNRNQNTFITLNDSLNIQWEYLGKPWGASTTHLQKLRNGIFYLRTQYDSWYTSTNNGDEWIKITSNIDMSNIHSLSEGLNGELFAVSEGVLYKSLDGGINWNIVATNIMNNIIFSNSGLLFSNNETTLLVSYDNGESWEAYALPNQNSEYTLSLSIDSQGRLFWVDDHDVLYYSDDNGMNWSFYDSLDIPQIFLPNSANRIKRIEIPTDSLLILVNRGDYGFKYSLTEKTLQMIVIPGSRKYYLGYSDDLIMWATSEKTYMDLKFYLMKSADMGESWVNIDNMYMRNGFPGGHPVRYAENSYLGRMGRRGLMKSTDGGFNWTTAEDGLNYNVVVSLAAINTDNLFIGTVKDFFYGGIYKYLGDDHWEQVMVNKETHRVWEINYRKLGKDIVTYSQSNFVILRNINLSPAWTKLNSLDYHPGPQYGSPIYYSSYLDRKGNLYTGINDWGIYHMKYDGLVWQIGNSGLPYDYIFFIDEDGLGNIIARTWREGKYYISEDGTSWDNWNSYLPAPNSFYSTDSSIIYACTDNGLYKSIDNGGSWSHIQQGEFLKIIYYEQINCLVAAVYEIGVLSSFDEGGTWTLLNDNPFFKAVRDIEVDLDGNLFIATERGGIYRTDHFKSLVEKASLPTETTVQTIYPNPTNSVITIKVSIAKEQNITWLIYNIRGQVVSVHKDQLSPGEYNKTMVLSELSSGVYFLNIKSSQINETVKFTIVK